MTTPYVLLIDDNPADRQLMEMAAEEFRADLTLRTCASFAEAQVLLDAGPRPDLVVTDLNLGSDDGSTLIAGLRLRQLTVAVITTDTNPLRQAYCLAAGASAVWRKPLHFDALAALLTEMRQLATGSHQTERPHLVTGR